VRIPWPAGLTPEQIRERKKAQDDRLKQYKQEREQEFEAAIATKDVPKLATLWRAAIENAFLHANGPGYQDIHEMSQLMLALATSAAIRSQPNHNMLVMRSVLAEYNGSRMHARPAFGLEPGMLHLRQAVSVEVDKLLIAHEAKKANGSSKEQQGPDTAPPGSTTSNQDDEEAAAHPSAAVQQAAGTNEENTQISPTPLAALAKRQQSAEKQRPGQLGAVDKALVRLLFQDLTTQWAMGTLHMSNKELAEQIRGSRSRRLLSGSLRPARIPHFLRFREYFRANKKGRPLDLIRGLPDAKLRDDLEQYASEAAEDRAFD